MCVCVCLCKSLQIFSLHFLLSLFTVFLDLFHFLSISFSAEYIYSNLFGVDIFKQQKIDRITVQLRRVFLLFRRVNFMKFSFEHFTSACHIMEFYRDQAASALAHAHAHVTHSVQFWLSSSYSFSFFFLLFSTLLPY